MSNRRKRQARRRKLTAHERWMADRYRPHRNYTAAEVRKILVDDGIARRTTPLTWLVYGVNYIALKERRDKDAVFIELQQDVRSRCGLTLPETGLVL